MMQIKAAFLTTSLAATITAAVVSITMAQGMGTGMMHGGMGPGMMGKSQDAQTAPNSRAAQGPMCSSGSCPCMQGGSSSGMMQGGTGYGMMGRGMRSGMMGSDTMHPMMHPDTAGADSRSGMGALFGSRVVRTLNLSVDDVRNYLSLRLDRLNNKRLKVGDVKSDDETITADIVTVDNSLVQRLKVERHTGAIEYEN